jgi:elongation factor P hydroxylase
LSGDSLAVQTAPTQEAKSAFADWILTRAGGFRASRCRDLNRQGPIRPKQVGNSLAVQTAPTQDAKSAFADWILTRAGGFRASVAAI